MTVGRKLASSALALFKISREVAAGYQLLMTALHSTMNPKCVLFYVVLLLDGSVSRSPCCLQVMEFSLTFQRFSSTLEWVWILLLRCPESSLACSPRR